MAASIISTFAVVSVPTAATVDVLNAAVTTGNVETPSTAAVSLQSQTPSTCDCTQLRYAVIALSTILGTLMVSLVVFATLRARRWTRKGARARNDAIRDLKRQKSDAERRERDMRERETSLRGYGRAEP